MPEEIKTSYDEDAAVVSPKAYKSDDYYSSVADADDSHPESSMYADTNSDREMSRSETSSCSDESGCYKQSGHETSVEIIPTRTIKTAVPKPAANPLQFVKIGPCDLYRSAQKQLQKTSDVKKPKQEVKDEIEDWQSNLDSWKFNRRKQQEHIIERVVEVKKLELEEHDRNRKRTKTFSEMMEERTSKGRKLSLPLYLEEESDDLSDLGLSSSKGDIKSIPEENDELNDSVHETQPHANDHCWNGYDEPDHVAPPEARCEATYEGAIQSYESRMKCITSGGTASPAGTSDSRKPRSTAASPSKTSTALPTTPRKYGRRGSATKIEEKLSELERIKNRSMSSTDLTEANKKQISIPKVNIFQRKEIFEKISDASDSSKNRRLSDELPAVRSIRERLSSLGKTVEETSAAAAAPIGKSKNVLLTEVSVKDRLSSINEKIRRQSAANSATSDKPTIKEHRWPPVKASSLDETATVTADHSNFATPLPPPPPPPPPKAEELITPAAAVAKEFSSGRSSSSSDDYEHVHQANHFHHRSLDSLQGRDSPNGFCFERVQSLECIDCCSNYPASVLSGDTDREDSGIHTADVSSSVSQADDFDLHADTSMDVDVVKSQHTPPPAAISDAAKADDQSSQSGFPQFISADEQPVATAAAVAAAGRTDEEMDGGGCRRDANAVVDTQRYVNEVYGGNQNCVQIAARVEELAAGVDVTDESVGGDGALEKTEDRSLVQSVDAAIEPEKEASEAQDCVRSVTQEIGDECPEESAIREDIIVPLNANHIETPSYRNQNFVDSDNEHVSTAWNGIEQNADYMYLMSSKFIEDKSDSVFDFEPSATAVEPPKEKPPPPPPLDNSSEESGIVENMDCLRRMDSTKRIKKEMRQKRSSFLGIEGYDDDSYLEPELESVKPPPDMTTFLQEERRLEKLLYRQSICSESDSTQGESRDSGVELDKNHNDENSWMPESVHSRQDSETYANTSTTSEEDEIIKKEREILEILELEEQRHYETESKNECNKLGEKLVLKLKELERQKNVVYWDQEDEQTRPNDQRRPGIPQNYQKYEEEPLQPRHPQQYAPSRQSADSALLQQQWAGRSLQDISQKAAAYSANTNEYNGTGSGGNSSGTSRGTKTRLDYRSSMPNIQQPLEQNSSTLAAASPPMPPPPPPTVPSHYRRQPPPIPTNKPAHFREPAAVAAPAAAAVNKVSSPQQMSKQTLQALSAVPRSKIVATDSWVMTKKKPRQETYNYQHWLIQEAEHRRITEYQQRQCKENNVNHNYMNVHPEFPEPTHPTDVPGLEGRVPSHPNRSALYAHPQMLPCRNHNGQTYDSNKSQAKPQSNQSNVSSNNNSKPLPDSVIQTLTQRVQNRFAVNDTAKQKRRETYSNMSSQQETMLSVSGKKKCSHCGEELGRGAAMIIESLRLFYHIDCFKCCVCCVQLGDGLMGTDVRVRNSQLHCHSCYSNDEGLKFSCV